MSTSPSERADVVLIRRGILSGTAGTMLKELEPSLDMVMFETLHDAAQESSQAWNNAGTGHAANCELNYTPQRADGSIDITIALEVNTEFDLDRKSTRLNSSHLGISYAVFCLKKKRNKKEPT